MLVGKQEDNSSERRNGPPPQDQTHRKKLTERATFLVTLSAESWAFPSPLEIFRPSDDQSGHF